MHQLIRNSSLPSQELLKLIRDHLFGDPTTYPPTPNTCYTGQANKALDAPITFTELQAVLARLTRSTTPGEDQITYCTHRNLDEGTLQDLLELYSYHW